MNLINELKTLQKGENITLRIIDEQAIKEIAYLALKNDSYESLFKSAIGQNMNSSFDIERFLSLYTENYILFKQKLQELAHDAIGSECYAYIAKQNIQWEINYNLSLITLYY